ncbi:hypothetical protein AN958_06848 [Leucoagaricus sp. SymC.cos]|nr:hypothetical protein AN958_06848 [Leucoagaricus sp. SymC.cos]
MRLRIQTLPPLPDLKAWFIQDEHQTPASIGDLKQLLCSNIGILKGAGVIPGDVQLLLDDFELLNESPFAAALRDGDLLCIKAVRSSTTRRRPKSEEKEGEKLLHDAKRKRAIPRDKEEKQRKLKSRKLAKPAYYESDSSHTSTSTSSTSSTSSPSSSSSSTSSSSSSEDSDSELSSPSAPPSLPSKPSKRSLPPTVTSPSSVSKPKSLIQGPFVPPGFGKSTTHARNLRRKRLRAAQAEQRTASILQPLGVSQANALPLGERQTPQSPSSVNGSGKGKEMSVDEGESMQIEPKGGRGVMMASLGNKNKKKGFKQFLTAPVPKKIVFMENGDAVVSSLTPASTSSPMLPPISQASTSKSPFPPPQQATEPSPQPQRPLPRLIPPSEIQERGELPPNMFVTSVDVEADLWNSKGKKKKQQAANNSYDYDYSLDNSYHGNGYQTGEDVTLSYGTEEDQHSQVAQDGAQADAQKNGVTSSFDWNKAEQLFDNAPKISSMDVIKTAKIVGWKSLDLNPQTFTPEILLIAAELLNYSDDTLSAKIQRLSRPVDPDSALSGFLAPVDPGDGAGEVVGEVEEYKLADILSSDWRVLRSS